MFNLPPYVWLPIGLILIAFGVFTAFLVLCTARRILDSGTEMPKGMLAVAYFWLVVGWPCDVLFNQTYGRLIFGEARGITFSAHVQWRVDNGLITPKTLMWANFLNAGMENHIKRLPE